MPGTVSLRDLTTEMMLELPDCPIPVAEFHLLRIARELCEATDVWQETFPTISYQAGVSTYFVITADARGELVRLTRYTMGGELQWARVEPRDDDPEDARYPADRPPFTLDAALDQVTFTDEPTGDIVFVGSMRPKLTASSLPTILRDRHMEALRFGTLSRLMAMGEKPWTDRVLAAHYDQRYRAAVNLAATRAARGNTRAPLRTRKWG